MLVQLGGVEHALLPTEAAWLASELLEAARDGLTNTRHAGGPPNAGFCGARGEDGWYCSKYAGHPEPHAYTAGRFARRDAQ